MDEIRLDFVGSLGPLVSKLSLAQPKPQPDLSKGTKDLLTFLEKRHKQYVAKQRQGRVEAPSQDLSRTSAEEGTEDDQVIAEHVVMCAKQRRRAKKVKLLHKRHSATYIKRLSSEQLSKSVEEKIGHTTPPQVGWATGKIPPACKIDKSKIVTKDSEKLKPSSWRLGTPVKREIRQIYRTALEVKDPSVLLASEIQPGAVAGSSGESRKKIPTIFLSECHSSLCPETGVPEVPPVTPESDHLRLATYIPSLHDIKSQRALKATLQELGIKRTHLSPKAVESDLSSQSDKLAQIKQQQRAEIYALNKVMGKLEEDNFKAMKESRV